MSNSILAVPLEFKDHDELRQFLVRLVRRVDELLGNQGSGSGAVRNVDLTNEITNINNTIEQTVNQVEVSDPLPIQAIVEKFLDEGLTIEDVLFKDGTVDGRDLGAETPVTEAERDAGTETALRTFSPFDIADMAGTHGGGGGGGGGSKTEIYTRTLIEEVELSAASSHTFSSIPSGYERLILVGVDSLSDRTNFVDGIVVGINGDTTLSNYHRQLMIVRNGGQTISESSSNSIIIIPGANASANMLGEFEVLIPRPDETFNKTARAFFTYPISSTEVGTGMISFVHHSATAAITSLLIQSSNAANISGTYRLYGEKTVTINGANTATIRAKELIEEIDLSAAASHTFSSLPSGYDKFIMEGENLRTDRAGNTRDALALYFNGDTTNSNYYRQNSQGQNGAALVSETTTPGVIQVCGATATANLGADFTAWITNPAGASFLKNAIVESICPASSTDISVGHRGMTYYSSVAALTSIQVISINSANITGTLRLYGEKDVVVGSTGVCKAKGTLTSSIANTEVDVEWGTPTIADSTVTITDEELAINVTGTYSFDVTVQATGNNNVELILRTYIDTGSGYAEDTDETVSDYIILDVDQNKGAVTLSTALELNSGDKVKFSAEGNADGTCTLETAGTRLRVLIS